MLLIFPAEQLLFFFPLCFDSLVCLSAYLPFTDLSTHSLERCLYEQGSCKINRASDRLSTCEATHTSIYRAGRQLYINTRSQDRKREESLSHFCKIPLSLN